MRLLFSILLKVTASPVKLQVQKNASKKQATQMPSTAKPLPTKRGTPAANDGNKTSTKKKKKLSEDDACAVPQLLLGWDDDHLYDLGYAQPEEIDSNKTNPCHEERAYLEYSIMAFDYNCCSRHSSPWDFVVINDNTCNPARAKMQVHSLQTIEKFYVPWFLKYERHHLSVDARSYRAKFKEGQYDGARGCC